MKKYKTRWIILKEKTQKELTDNFDYLSNAASTTDCTGLIPSLPQNEDELEAYNDIVQYMSPAAKSSMPAKRNVLPDKKQPSASGHGAST